MLLWYRNIVKIIKTCELEKKKKEDIIEKNN